MLHGVNSGTQDVLSDYLVNTTLSLKYENKCVAKYNEAHAGGAMAGREREVTCTLSDIREVYDTDWKGCIREDASDAFVKIECTIVTDDNCRVAFIIIASFPKVKIIKSEEVRYIGDQLGRIARKAIPIFLADIKGIDLFRTHRISLDYYLGKASTELTECSEERSASFNCIITSETYLHICDQFAEYSNARQSFDYAVSKLREFADYPPYGLKCHQSEVLTMLGFIDRSLDSADVGDLYQWYREKQLGIGSRFKDLLRRKNGDHPGYKLAQEYIRRTLFSYHAPTVWLKNPPIIKSDNFP